MTKKDFLDFLKYHLDQLPPKEQNNILFKMENLWIPQYKNDFVKKYTMCNVCKKYFHKNSFRHETITEIKEDVFIDCPIDPNEHFEERGNVKYKVQYLICPECSGRKEISREKMEVISRYIKYH